MNRHRDKYIAFWVSEEEKEIIQKNAKRRRLDVSKYCRVRTTNEDMSMNEALNFLVMFINKILDERSGVSDAKTWKTWKLKDLTKPLDVKLKGLTLGMAKEEREKFEANWNEKMTEYGKLGDDLKNMLDQFYIE